MEIERETNEQKSGLLKTIRKRTIAEFCLESGKMGVSVTLLVLIILVNHNTYSLVKCMATQMESLTSLPPDVRVKANDDCVHKVGDAVTMELCHENASTSTLYVYAWHRRLTILLETPTLENIAEWLTKCANGHCNTLRSTECRRLSQTTFGGYTVQMCFDDDGHVVGATIDGFHFSTNDTRSLIALLR